MHKIIVIEDNPFFRLMISDLLTIEGHDVTTAKDGLQGLQLVKDLYPDLILCGINIPQVNGYEILNQLREDATTSTIPFAFLTAESYLNGRVFTPEPKPHRYLARTVEIIDLPKILPGHLNNSTTFQQLSLCHHSW